jgi:DNA-binding response OmpR family regulator
MDDLDSFGQAHMPTAKRPLLGLTILVVEDSRFASEAMRLMCLRSGARIRRADSLRAARRHLQVYRPSLVIIDLGLPDGSGLDLIEELNRAVPRVSALIATSGDDHLEASAAIAGADAFLNKPVDCLGVFQQTLLSALPVEWRPSQPGAVSDEVISPDRLAYRDDMSHVAALLDDQPEGQMLDYLAQFTGSVARTADDAPLEHAARDLAKTRSRGGSLQTQLARLAALVQDRISERAVI